jgi:hypothetical protein
VLEVEESFLKRDDMEKVEEIMVSGECRDIWKKEDYD